LQNINKKNLYKLLFIIIILGFIVSLVGCNWLSLGLLNVFDPQAQIRVNYKLDGVTTQGTADISFGIFSLNEAEFIGTGFLFEYYNEGVKITDPELSRMVGATFYVPPYPLSSFEKPVSIEFPLYFQDVLDYMTLHPLIVEITSTITVIGTDGADHDISKTITFDLPTILPGIDFIPPVARIVTDPLSPSGYIPLTITFDGSQSCDKRNENSECDPNGIKSFLWNFGDGTTSTSVVVSHAYDTPGSYLVTLTVTDYFDNQDIATVTVAAGDSAGPTAAIEIKQDPPYIIDQNITFDGTDSAVSEDCGCGTTIVSYEWDFGDGETDSGSIVNHTYVTVGTYTVTLTVTDSNGKSAVTVTSVTVITII